MGGYWGVIDIVGNTIIDFTFDSSSCPFEGASHGTITFCEFDEDGYIMKYGLLTTDGKLVKEPSFMQIGTFMT